MKNEIKVEMTDVGNIEERIREKLFKHGIVVKNGDALKVLDLEGDFEKIIKSIGGKFITINPQSNESISINPLKIVEPVNVSGIDSKKEVRFP